MAKPDKINKDKETSWGGVANWYDDMLSNDDTYQSKVILPNLIRILPPENKKIIDIACGQGFFSEIYARSGADVLGVDISPELIKIANSKVGENLQLRFEVSSADNLSNVKSSIFDAAIIVLALQNINDLGRTIKEAARVLVKNGQLVIVLNHPCFRIAKGSSWGFDENSNVQFRRIDKYGRPFSSEVDMNPGESKSKKHTISFHRPLQDYFKSLASAGLSVVGLEEWISHKTSNAGPRADAENDARKEFPMFLTIVAKKS